MTDLTPQMAAEISTKILNSLFNSAANYDKSSEALEMSYWMSIAQTFNGSMDDVDKLPQSLKDEMIHIIDDLRYMLIKFFTVTDATLKFYSIVSKPEHDWSDEEKSIHEYMMMVSKVIDDIDDIKEDHE